MTDGAAVTHDAGMTDGAAVSDDAGTADGDQGVSSLSRRQMLGAGLAGVGAAGVGWAVGTGTADRAHAAEVRDTTAKVAADPALIGASTVPFHGAHQAGILTPPQAHGTWTALDLAKGATREDLIRLMRIWTTDAARLTQGRPGLSDAEPELAFTPSNLTVTVGFGPKVFTYAGREDRRPAWCRQLPDFGQIDKEIVPEWSEGDLLLQVCADDAISVAHAVRVLLRGARSFGRIRWQQRGFRRSFGVERPGQTMRNLLGQVDGTRNPPKQDLEDLVWVPGAGSEGAGGATAPPARPGERWMAGGSSMVIRRIRMELEAWEQIDRPERERTVGRRMASGAPLTGAAEFDEPDLEAKDARGRSVIDPLAHIRRSRTDESRHRFLRRPYNYDDHPGGAGAKSETSDSGLLFITFQADIDEQFIPIQRRLAEGDLLNVWTVPVGSAVFAIPPGVEPGEYLGHGLLA